ncbi:MAG: VapB-type antitoxin [Thermoprotei archaeon]|nr:MAG: VapB-type antitoxin [Thermoprotei archaeon]
MALSYTTIKVSKKTLKQLDELKKRFGSKTYEETILRLIEEYKKKMIEEYFGIDRGKITSFSEEDRGEDREY